MSVSPKQADRQPVNSPCLVNPDSTEGTFPKLKQDISQWDFSKPVWVMWNLLLAVLDTVLLTYAMVEGAFSETALKSCSRSVVPLSAGQSYGTKWAFSFGTMRGSDLA